MIIEHQDDILQFLASEGAYPGSRGPVERIDTHGAVVFLVGDRAYKLKRAVRYDYMDFSTVARRRDACEAEVRINSRTAPNLYLGTVAIVRRPDGSLKLDGPGEPIDWLVEMRRFDQQTLLDRRARRGDLDVSTMIAVADAVAELHASAEARSDHGGPDSMRWVVNGNTAAFDEDGTGVVDTASVRDLHRLSHETIDRVAGQLEERRRGGLVRQCHGDLHLRNICTIDDRPILFDAVEFNDEIACVDVLYDLAFLLMDVHVRRLPDLANVVHNRYMTITDDLAGLSLLPLFQSCRAAIRAKTSLAAARLEQASESTASLHVRARDYLEAALMFIRPARPRLVAIGGVSGTGKSTLAAGLAPRLGPPPGAIVIRSDAVRKRLCGAAPTDRLGPEGYRPEVTDAVYQAMGERAGRVVDAGHSAIVDGVFGRPGDRRTLDTLARAAGVAFTGLYLDAATDQLEARVAGRMHDVSDATVDVLHAQLERTPGPLGWTRVDASVPPGDVLRHVSSLLSLATP